MKFLLLCMVSVLFVSVTFAVRVEFKEYFVKDSDNTNVKGVDDISSVSEINLPEDLEVESVKRLKKSYYGEPPCESCAHNRNPFHEIPSVEYSNSQYRSFSGDNYYNVPPRTHYPDIAPAYSPQSYNAPSYSPQSYNPPSYSPQSYNAPSYSPQSYNSPSYSPQSYNAPSYSPQSYNAPSYSPQSYNTPYSPQTYNSPSYHPPTYSAPSYHTSTYKRPSHQQPTYLAYENNKHPASAYPSPSNIYPPHHGIPSSNLLVGCHPHVSPYPDLNHLSQSYSQLQKQNPKHSEETSPSYRFHSTDASSISVATGDDPNTDESMPEKVPLLDNSESEKDNSAKNPTKNENNETTKLPEQKNVPQPQQETLFKMASRMQQSHNQNQLIIPVDDKQKKEQVKGMMDRLLNTANSIAGNFSN